MTFYPAQLFTSKRGPLAQIWLAAHWERKLTKTHVFECNLEATIRDIISPKMKLGLRTSSHLFVGVVRIYSRKAKYLLADCSDALVKIKMAFRPGQTDMPLDGLEATLKAITLMEDFTAFDSQLPPLSTIDVVDHFSLNQCRSEEITLKEDFGCGFLNLVDFGDDSQSHHNGLLDMSFQSFIQNDDFGDENRGLDLLDFLTISSENPECTDFILEEPQARSPEIAPLDHQRDAETEMGSPTRNETTLLDNEAEAFALEPVAVTSNSETKRGKRKRKLVVDQTKELTDERIRGQLLDYSDLVASLDMAPPTVQLMQWKESGAADKLFAHPCSTVAAPEIMTLFARSVFQVKSHVVHKEVEEMRRNGQAVQRDTASLTTDDVRDVESSIDPETHDTQLTALQHVNDHPLENHSEDAQGQNSSEVTHPGLPSEDSMFVHPSFMQQESSLHTQSMLDSQDLEERRTTRRTQKLLDILRSNSDAATFSLQALCEGGSRLRAATTFFSLLILKKLNAIHLHQRAPYEDISATPGANFYNEQQPNRGS